MALRFNTIMRALLAGNSTPSVPSFYFNFSNPSNVTLGAAQARGTITSTQNAHITMSASLSRVVGVAPLYVNIDMTGTTSDLTANATHDLFYSVNWGDPGAGAWANGVQSAGLTDKNWSFGPVGGHVFETPGTYLVTPTSTDGVNSAAKPGYITVLDPNVVYAGTNTICISHSNNFTGAPSGATQVNTAGNTDMYAAWNTYKASNKRILFCKADSWTSSAQMTMPGLVGTTVGGYGTGVAHTFASGTMVSVTPAAGITGLFECGGSTDCRVMNLRVACDATHVAFYVSSTDSVALTLYKVEVRGATCAFSIGTGASGAGFFKNDQHCTYECLNDEVYGYAGATADTPRVTGATVSAGGVFTATGHKFNRFNKVQLTGTMPSGFSLATDYYISASSLTANTFRLSTSFAADTPITSSGVGTCDVTAQSLGGGQGAFIGLTRGGVMGCYFDNCNHGEQSCRVPYINTGHINNNYIARPNQTKNVLKIHCREYNDISGVSSGYSEKIVVHGNVLDLRGGYSYNDTIPNNGQVATFVGDSAIIIGHGGGGASGERVRNVIVQNNFTHGCTGNPKDGVGFIAINCPNSTVRNNIADFSFGDRATAYVGPYAYTGLHFAGTTTSTPDQTIGIRLYNNTMYSNLENAQTVSFLRISAATSPNPEVDNVRIKNNLWYLPFATTSQNGAYELSLTAAPTDVIATNNTDSVAGGGATGSPNFVATPPVLLSDWRPNTGSYAIGTGAALPVMRDFNNVTRVGAGNHLGAVLP